MSLLAPACAAVKGEEGDQEEKLLPAVQAEFFSRRVVVEQGAGIPLCPVPRGFPA